jgi:hypothetical protein
LLRADRPRWAAEWTRIRVARDFGKWPHELDELDVDEFNRLVAFQCVEHYELTGDMPRTGDER